MLVRFQKSSTFGYLSLLTFLLWLSLAHTAHAVKFWKNSIPTGAFTKPKENVP